MSAAAATPCPVCAEPLTGRPERCFRCETPLGAWWGFEDALGEEAAAVVRPPARYPQRVAFFSVLAVTVALAGGVVAFWQAAPEAPAEAARPFVVPSAPAPLPSVAPTPAPSRVVRYRVQRGDSLWRVAAALTGDGRRWKELFPGRADGDAPLVVGTVLEIDLAHSVRSRD